MMAPLRPHSLSPRSATPAGEAVPPRTYHAFGQLPAHAARRIALAATAAALLLTPAAAQRVLPADTTAYARAIAAGYKALTLCNGIFSAGRTREQVEAVELKGIYPEYDALVPQLSATVVPDRQLVTVDWSDTLPPRAAQWAANGRGCRLDRIGAGPDPRRSDYRYVAPAGPDARAWPMGDAGIAPRPAAMLSHTVDQAFGGAYGTGTVTTGVVIVRDGRIVAERYAPDWGPFTSNRTWSAAKSIAGTVIGLAKLDPARPADIPEWKAAGDPRAVITLDQLLRMASGLHSGAAGNRTDNLYFGGTAVGEEATSWPLETAPGKRFRYANDDILLAMRALRAESDDLYHALPPTLFQLLGMSHTEAGLGPGGDYILSSQVWSTARDLARLGQFWLQDGVWQGKRLLPEGWVKYMTTPSGPQPAEGPGYGATLWLFGPKQGLPPGSYAAQGNRGQYIMVVPSERLVVVRRGEDPGAARFDIARFTADVVASR